MQQLLVPSYVQGQGAQVSADRHIFPHASIDCKIACVWRLGAMRSGGLASLTGTAGGPLQGASGPCLSAVRLTHVQPPGRGSIHLIHV